MRNRPILLLLLSVVVVEPRPQEEIPVRPIVPFNFGYEISAENTGDTKTHQETLEDDGVLRGSYTVVQPDGLRRVVKYTSDAENGFRADVTFEKGYENVIPQTIQDSSSTLSNGLSSSSSSSIRGPSSLRFNSGGATRQGSSSVGSTSGGSSIGGSSSARFSTGGAVRGGSTSQGFTSGGSSSSGFISGGATRGGSISSRGGSITGSSPIGFTSGGSTRKGSSTVGLSSGANAQFSSFNSAKPSPDNLSSGNLGSFQGLTSGVFASSSAQFSGNAEPEKAQFTEQITPTSSLSISSGSSVQNRPFINNDIATTPESEINDGSVNLLNVGSFGDIYTNRQLFCAGCNSGVIANTKTETGISVSDVNNVEGSPLNAISATGGSSSVGLASGAPSTVGSLSIVSTSAGASSGGSSSAGFTSGGSTIGSTSGTSLSGVSASGGSISGDYLPPVSAAGGSSLGSSTGDSLTTKINSGGSTSGIADFNNIFSNSFLVASENLDSIDQVQLSNAGFNTEQLYAYKLVPIKIVDESTTA